MQIDKKKVGEKIHEIRKQNGYSMEQFGKQIGDAPRGSVNSWEKGVNLPNKERLEMIAIMGNTTVDELLYGSLYEYVNNLIVNNLGVKISYHFTKPFVEKLKENGYSYGDDIQILRYLKGFFNSNNVTTLRPSIFFKAISDKDNLFVGYLDVNQVICPYYFAYSDVKKNTLHVIPFNLNKISMERYSYSPKLTEAGEHDYFTSGFLALKLSLRDFTLFYYGIDIVGKCMQISKFNFDVDTDSLVLDKKEVDVTEMYVPFMRDIKKEVLYLRHAEAGQV